MDREFYVSVELYVSAKAAAALKKVGFIQSHVSPISATTTLLICLPWGLGSSHTHLAAH